MTFYATNFVYDGVPSETYNITMSTIGESTYSAPSGIELFTESVYRKPKVYLYGTAQRPVMQFPVKVNTPTDLDSDELSKISSWLFGRSQYAKLQIIQPDMGYIYYNCLLTNPKVQKVGAMIRGIECDVVCDSPFAWEYPRTYIANYAGEIVGSTFTFINNSDDRGYLYPTLVLTANEFSGSIQLTNYSDDSRIFLYTGVVASEVLTFNNDIQQITTSRAVKILSNFNKNWFRLVQGVNLIGVTGNISRLEMTYQFARKMI